MKFFMQDPFEALFAFANFEQGRQGRSPKGCKAKKAKPQWLRHFVMLLQILFGQKIKIVEDSASEPRVTGLT